MLEKIVNNVGEILKIEYCPICYDHTIENSPELIFHSINPDYLKYHKDLIIKPENRTKPKPKPAKNYHKYFDKDYIHLGPISIIGLTQEKNKIHFGFELNELKQKYPEINFLDFNTWEEIGFHDLDDESQKRKNLFLKDYIYDLENPVEVLLPELDLTLSKHAITYSAKTKKALEETIKTTNLSPKINFAKGLGNIRMKYLESLSKEQGCHS